MQVLGISGSPVNNSNTDRLVKTVDQIAAFMQMEGINVIGKVSGTGNIACLSCGYGGTCGISGVPLLFGKGAVPSKDKYISIEGQKDVIEKANEIGQKIMEMLVGK